MKRSRMLIKMQRVYAIRHVMLESGYISLEQFMDELLQEIEHEGMSPPFIDKSDMAPYDIYFTMHVSGARYPGVLQWEPEDE